MTLGEERIDVCLISAAQSVIKCLDLTILNLNIALRGVCGKTMESTKKGQMVLNVGGLMGKDVTMEGCGITVNQSGFVELDGLWNNT